MFDGFFTTIGNLINELSWKKIANMIVIIFILVIIVFVIDISTKFFTLQRLEKEIKLYIEIADKSNNPILDEIHNKLADKLYKCVNSEIVTSGSVKDISIPQWLKLFISLSYPWFILSLFFIPGTLKKDKSSSSVLLGVIVFGCFIGFIGIFIPVLFSKIFRYGLLPWMFFFLFIIVILVIQAIKKKS